MALHWTFSMLAGLLAGSLHVLSGPDHLAALAPLVSGGGRRAVRVGARWGLGHAAGVGIIGALALAAREVLPVERISSAGERVVGVVLVAIGLWSLVRAQRSSVHVHVHGHGGVDHAHVHAHVATPHAAPRAHDHSHAASWIGVLHGLSGGSHLVGMLPALALSRGAAVSYALGFGGGTIAAMVVFTLGVGLLAGRAAHRGTGVRRSLQYACSAAALVVGLFWLVP